MRAYPALLLALLTGPALSQESQGTAPEPAAEPAIMLQLNKLEANENACHVYVVINNQTPQALQELKIDVYLFDKQSIVLQGIALQFTEVGASREMVVPFELPDVRCDAIGRILLNKVLTCTDSGGAAVEGCGDRVATSSLTEIPFER